MRMVVIVERGSAPRCAVVNLGAMVRWGIFCRCFFSACRKRKKKR